MKLLARSFLLLSILITPFLGTSQTTDSLVAFVDNQLIKINVNDAGWSPYQTISNMPANTEIRRLTWSASLQSFYFQNRPTSATYPDGVGKFDNNGNYSFQASVTVPGDTCYFTDGLAYSPASDNIYFSGTVGTGPPSDWWSESLLRIDTSTWQSAVIGTFSHSGTVNQPEADIMSIDNQGVLYYEDSEGGGSPYARFYQSSVSDLNNPTLIYDAGGGANIYDMVVANGFIYYARDRVLHKVEITSGTHTTVGTIFTSGDFNGNVILGIARQTSSVAKIEEVDNPTSFFTCFPNPSNGLVNINFEAAELSDVQIEVVDIQGKLVFNKEFLKSGPTIELDLKHIESGTYILKITNDDLTQSEQIIIE